MGKYFKIDVDTKEQDLYSKLVNNILNKDTVEIDDFGRRRIRHFKPDEDWQKDIYYLCKERLYKIKKIIDDLTGTGDGKVVGKTTWILKSEEARIKKNEVNVKIISSTESWEYPDICIPGKNCHRYKLKTRKWKKGKGELVFKKITTFFDNMEKAEGGEEKAVDELWDKVVKFQKNQERPTEDNLDDVHNFLDILNNGMFFNIRIDFKLNIKLDKDKIYKYVINTLSPPEKGGKRKKRTKKRRKKNKTKKIKRRTSKKRRKSKKHKKKY